MRLSTIALTAVALANCSLPQTERTAASTPPEGVLKHLASDEKEYCERFLGSYKKGCHETFRANLAWFGISFVAVLQVVLMGAFFVAGMSLSGDWL